jgi:hypothetical protein
MQPRIYTYKITFEEVSYYYYGSKKEKVQEEEYWGSPVTNKWCWELYTPKKQILELFDYTDEGYEECRKVEDRLIKPVLNDPWCLNESCGGNYSIKIRKETGRKSFELKKGLFSISQEKRKNMGKESGEKLKINKKGIFGLNEDEKIKNCKKGGKKCKELKVGYFARDEEQKTKDGKKGASITNSRKFKCTVTGFTSTSGPLTRYQRKRGIDPINRIEL